MGLEKHKLLSGCAHLHVSLAFSVTQDMFLNLGFVLKMLPQDSESQSHQTHISTTKGAHFFPWEALSGVSNFGYCNMTLSFMKPILRNHTVMLQIYHKNHILIKHVNSCWATSMAILVTCNSQGQVGHADKDFHSCERRLVLSR